MSSKLYNKSNLILAFGLLVSNIFVCSVGKQTQIFVFFSKLIFYLNSHLRDGEIRKSNGNKPNFGIKYKPKGGHLKEIGELINGHYNRRPGHRPPPYNPKTDESYNVYTCDNIPEVKRCSLSSCCSVIINKQLLFLLCLGPIVWQVSSVSSWPCRVLFFELSITND